MSDSIPLLDLPAQHGQISSELCEKFADAVSTAGFIGGKHVADFEAGFATFCEVAGCVGVANGTDALMLSLRALDVGPGDEVLLPALTFIATAEAVSMVGAQPRFVDVTPDTYTIDPAVVEALEGPNVKAMIPVHLYGQAADLDELLMTACARGWRVVEDAAQAHGAAYKGRPVGAHGDLGCFSFYPGKNLGALGDGGAVIGNDQDLLDRIRLVGNHGRVTKTLHGEPGVNSRLDAIQAMALGVKLPLLRGWNAGRAKVAGWYAERLQDVAGIKLPVTGKDRTHVYHQYVVQVPERDVLVERLRNHRIASAVHYPVPLHLQPAYESLGYGVGDFPVAESVAGRCLSLPMFPELTQAQVDRICSVVVEYARAGV